MIPRIRLKYKEENIMANTITFELCEEDRKQLQLLNINLMELIARIKGETPDAEQIINAAKGNASRDPIPAEEHPVADPFPAPAQELPQTTPVPFETTATAPTVSRGELQSKVVQLSAAGKKSQVREIVTRYAARVSEIPEDKLATVMSELGALA